MIPKQAVMLAIAMTISVKANEPRVLVIITPMFPVNKSGRREYDSQPQATVARNITAMEKAAITAGM